MPEGAFKPRDERDQGSSRSASPSDRALPSFAYRRTVREANEPNKPETVGSMGERATPAGSSPFRIPRPGWLPSSDSSADLQQLSATPTNSSFADSRTSSRVRQLPPILPRATDPGVEGVDNGGVRHQRYRSQPSSASTSSVMSSRVPNQSQSWTPSLDLTRDRHGNQHRGSRVQLSHLPTPWTLDPLMPSPPTLMANYSQHLSSLAHPRSHPDHYMFPPSLRPTQSTSIDSIPSLSTMAGGGSQRIEGNEVPSLRWPSSTESEYDSYPRRSNPMSLQALSSDTNATHHEQVGGSVTSADITSRPAAQSHTSSAIETLPPGPRPSHPRSISSGSRRGDEETSSWTSASSQKSNHLSASSMRISRPTAATSQRSQGTTISRMLPPLSSLTSSLASQAMQTSVPVPLPLSDSGTTMNKVKPISWNELAEGRRRELLRGTLQRFMIRRATLEVDALLETSPAATSTWLERNLAKARETANDEFFVTVTCSHSGVAQKSYGHEKRFLCPPPIVRLRGTGYSTAPLNAKAQQLHLRMCVLPTAEAEGASMCTPSPRSEAGAEDTLVAEDVRLDDSLNAKFGHLYVGAKTSSAKTFQLQLRLCEPFNQQRPAMRSPQQKRRASASHEVSNPTRTIKSPRLSNTLEDPASACHPPPLRGVSSGSTILAAGLYHGYVPNAEATKGSKNASHSRRAAAAATDPLSSGVSLECNSGPITVISKPSKKTTRAKSSNTQITPRLAICLFNRVNSQNVRTRYMAVDQGKLTARNDSWGTFYMRPVRTFGIKLEDGSFAESTAVTYGSVVVLEQPATGMVSDEMVVCRVERGRIIVPTAHKAESTSSSSSPSPSGRDAEQGSVGGPISQMQKVAFMKYEPAKVTSKLSLAPPSVVAHDERQGFGPRLFLCSDPSDPWWRPMGANENYCTPSPQAHTSAPLDSLSASDSTSASVSSSSSSPSNSRPPPSMRRISSGSTTLPSSLGSSKETSLSTPPTISPEGPGWTLPRPPSQQLPQQHRAQRSPLMLGESQQALRMFGPEYDSTDQKSPMSEDKRTATVGDIRPNEVRHKSISPLEASVNRSSPATSSSMNPALPGIPSTPAVSSRPAFSFTESLAPTPLTFLPAGRDPPTKEWSATVKVKAHSADESMGEAMRDEDVADDAFCWSIVGAASFEYSFCHVGNTQQQTNTATDEGVGATGGGRRQERPLDSAGPPLLCVPTMESVSGVLRTLHSRPSYSVETHSLHLEPEKGFDVSVSCSLPMQQQKQRIHSAPSGSSFDLWPGVSLWLGSLGPLPIEMMRTFSTRASASASSFYSANNRGETTPMLAVRLPPLPDLVRYAASLCRSDRPTDDAATGKGGGEAAAATATANQMPLNTSANMGGSSSSASSASPRSAPHPTAAGSAATSQVIISIPPPSLPLLLVEEANGLVSKTPWSLGFTRSIASTSNIATTTTSTNQTWSLWVIEGPREDSYPGRK